MNTYKNIEVAWVESLGRKSQESILFRRTSIEIWPITKMEQEMTTYTLCRVTSHQSNYSLTYQYHLYRVVYFLKTHR